MLWLWLELIFRYNLFFAKKHFSNVCPWDSCSTCSVRSVDSCCIVPKINIDIDSLKSEPQIKQVTYYVLLKLIIIIFHLRQFINRAGLEGSIHYCPKAPRSFSPLKNSSKFLWTEKYYILKNKSIRAPCTCALMLRS